MKLKEGFMLTEIADETVAVPVGEAAERFRGIIRLNETAAFIVKRLQEETTREALIEALSEEYDGPREQLASGVDGVLEQLRSCGALEE